jgi:hypothetical protein
MRQVFFFCTLFVILAYNHYLYDVDLKVVEYVIQEL